MILVVVITLDSFFVAYHARQDVTRQTKEELVTNGRLMLRMPLRRIIDEVPNLAHISQARITIVDSTGKVLADSEEDIHNIDNHLYRPEIQEARIKGEGSVIRYSQTLHIDMMYVALPFKEKSNIVGYVRLSKPIRQIDTIIGNFYQAVLRISLIILISFLLLSLFFIPRLISPLLKITTYTEKVRGKDFPGRLLVYSRDEIGQLAYNINLLVKKYEDSLHSALEEREKLESAFSSMIEGIVILNRENRIERINKSMEDILGESSLNVIGKTPIEIFRNPELQDRLAYCRKTSEPFSQEFLFIDGQKFLKINVALIKDETRAEQKMIMVFHDVTKLKKLERMRADFVANVTHEIKTPLTAIIGFVQTLQEGAIDDQVTAGRFLNIISENASRLNRLVDDLLTLSSIELGEKKFHIEKIDAGTAVDKAVAVIEKKATEKGLYIRMDLPDGLPPILADADALTQILVNILDNAVKFTSSGGITVSTVDERGYLAILIADSGMGIPAHEISRLGERFYRVDKMRSRELGGTGLGLSIVKHLLIAQHGYMEVKSIMNKGTIVKIFFPVFIPSQKNQ